MGDVVRAKFGNRPLVARSAVGDLVIGRLLYGPHAGCWVVAKVAAVDDDGVCAMVEDAGEKLSIWRLFENADQAPLWHVAACDLKPGAVEDLTGEAAGDLADLKPAFRRWAKA